MAMDPQNTHVNRDTTGVRGWLANVLDLKHSDQVSIPECDRLRTIFQLFRVDTCSESVGSACLASVYTKLTKIVARITDTRKFICH